MFYGVIFSVNLKVLLICRLFGDVDPLSRMLAHGLVWSGAKIRLSRGPNPIPDTHRRVPS